MITHRQERRRERGQRAPSRQPRRMRLAAVLLALAALVSHGVTGSASRAMAQQGPPSVGGSPGSGGGSAKSDEDTRPYDERLSRLSELLGSIHFLRELCGANEGQQWRDRMKDILDNEGTSALRRARLTRSFNAGWRLFSRTYSSCTPSAQATVQKFLAEAAQIAEGLSKQP